MSHSLLPVNQCEVLNLWEVRGKVKIGWLKKSWKKMELEIINVNVGGEECH